MWTDGADAGARSRFPVDYLNVTALTIQFSSVQSREAIIEILMSSSTPAPLGVHLWLEDARA